MSFKTIKLICTTTIIIGVVSTIAGMAIKIRGQTALIEQSQQTVSAYAAENDSLIGQCKMFKMDLATMRNLNDSIMNKMIDQAKLLKIKDKHIQSLQYKLDHTEKTVTVVVKDTIFLSPDLKLDTCLMDKWSEINLHLQYPSTIQVNAQFDNEQYVIVHWKKVPIKVRKCKIAEWFTKKRKEVTVDVVSKNPYVKTQKQRFVEIVD